MKHATRIGLATTAGVAGGALVGFFLVRAAVRSRCRRKVRGSCRRVLLPDSTCRSMAEGICVGAAPTDAPFRGERLRRGREVVSRRDAVAGCFTVGKTPAPPPPPPPPKPSPIDVLTSDQPHKGATRARRLRR